MAKAYLLRFTDCPNSPGRRSYVHRSIDRQSRPASRTHNESLTRHVQTYSNCHRILHCQPRSLPSIGPVLHFAVRTHRMESQMIKGFGTCRCRHSSRTRMHPLLICCFHSWRSPSFSSFRTSGEKDFSFNFFWFHHQLTYWKHFF